MSDAISRFNKYKGQCDTAASLCVRTFLHLVRPTERFPYHSNEEIKRAWREWKDAEEVFYRMTGKDEPPVRTFPPPPPEDSEHKPCRQMWGCLVQEQVEREDFQAPSIKEAVAAIMASEACKSHPASCACHVPNNPWTWHECVAELEPLGLKHNPKCQCGGWKACKQKLAAEHAAFMVSAQQKAEAELVEKPWLDVGCCRCDAQYSAVSCSCLPGRLEEAKVKSAKMAAAAATAAVRATEEVKAVMAAQPQPQKSVYDYTHEVDTCACGTCYKARMDSGTGRAYSERCQRNSALALKRMNCPECKATKEVTGQNICMECHVELNSYDMKNRLKMPSELHMLRQGYVLEEASYIATKKAAEAAAAAMSTAATKSGGVLTEDFAKNLFAAMGTPHDSTCPHGLPFYSCMPCSH